MKKFHIIHLACLMLAWFTVASAEAQPVRRTRNGIIIVGAGNTLRAIEPFSGSHEDGTNYAAVVNRYQQEFPTARIFCMVIPNSAAYYCPDTASTWTHPQPPAIQHIYQQLSEPVQPIDIYPVLAQHTDEPIYSRTDHHWSPLGAYYAAQKFAQVAGVPFRDISTYDSHVIHNYVGSMYRFSHDITVKQAPEDFIYYTPRDVEYTTVRTNYTLTANRQSVMRIGTTDTCSFFRPYDDGSSAAYCTFMGGDTNTTSVRTSTRNQRRLMILKDSYGNALPGYLFGSFEEIHIVDCRYFTPDMRAFVQQHGITDILFANNILHASMPKTSQSYKNYLGQQFTPMASVTPRHRQPVQRRHKVYRKRRR